MLSTFLLYEKLYYLECYLEEAEVAALLEEVEHSSAIRLNLSSLHRTPLFPSQDVLQQSESVYSTVRTPRPVFGRFPFFLKFLSFYCFTSIFRISPSSFLCIRA